VIASRSLLCDPVCSLAGALARNMSLKMSRRQSFSVSFQLVAVFAVALGGPVAARAQGASVSAVVISAQHMLLGSPLTGGALGVSIRRRDSPVALHFEAAISHGHAGRIGVPCAGLIQPGTCAAEPLRDETRLTSISGGTTFRVFHRRHVLVALTGDLMLASLRADTRGLTSGQTLTASKTLWGGLVGAHAAWTPVARVPVALQIDGGVGGLMPIARELVVDGYTPFERGIQVRRLRLGIAWQP